MSRPKRINLPGCVYHVICRSNRHDVLFQDDDDRERFLKYLTDYLEQFEMRIHAYCLMDTHFHLLIESRKSNLSEYMRRVLTAYAVWFNKRHHTRGHIFAGRFKSIVVERGDYLVAVSRYIHRNPVEASIVKIAEDYAWSSMRIYTGKSEPGFVYSREILAWFGNRKGKYGKFVREGLDEELKTIVLSQRYLGSEAFAKRMNIRLKRENQPSAMAESERGIWREEERWKEGKKIADRHLKEACSKLGCKPMSFIRIRRKTGIYKEAMVEIINHLRKESEWTFRHIARYFQCSTKYAQRLYYQEQKEKH